MTVEQSRIKEIEEIINQFKCPKDFQCYKSNFEALCDAEDIGIESSLTLHKFLVVLLLRG
jgi:hypothetical protein